MTATLISLISIIIGIFGAYTIAYIFKKYSLGLIGNTIAGVFGSVLFIKLFGSLGFDPKSILQYGIINIGLFALNSIVSLFSGAFAVILVYKLKNKVNNS